MKKVGDSFELSAIDLVGYLNCRHLAGLDRAVADGALSKPKVWDPLLQILAERGTAHEQSYIEHLTTAGLDVVRIDGIDVTFEAASETRAAMQRGVPVIAQAALAHQGWNGRADILRRVEVSSALGGWSYEPIDTKLARETKAGTILQLSLCRPAGRHAGPSVRIHVCRRAVVGVSAAAISLCRLCGVFPEGKACLLTAMAAPATDDTYPDPIEHCDICRWRESCDKRRRDDHSVRCAYLKKF